MELLLIRHALPIRRELESGAADPELSEDGLAQAVHLAQYLSSEHLDAVYASSMQRARQTAEPVAASRDLEIALRDGITEFDRFSSEYVPVEELKAANDPRWQQMLAGEWDGDESQDEFRARTVTAIEEIIAAHSGQRVAVVCHGGVINAYLTTIMGLTDETSGGSSRGFFYPNYTSIHRVAASSRGDRSVITINETSHLRNTGLPMGLFQKG
jgi:probable phosphoglycerate mutase